MRVSVRRLGNELTPVSNVTAFTSTMIAAARKVKKQTSPLLSALTIKRFEATGDTAPS
jgi:hypothetical protein